MRYWQIDGVPGLLVRTIKEWAPEKLMDVGWRPYNLQTLDERGEAVTRQQAYDMAKAVNPEEAQKMLNPHKAKPD